jgi:acyl carrier protein
MSRQYTDEEVIALFRSAVWEVDHRSLPDLELETRVSDLGLSSVVTLEVMGYLEEQLDLQLPDEQLARTETLRDLSRLINQLSNRRP